MAINLAIVGATGNVGRTFLQVLDEMNVPFDSIKMFTSKRSAGNTLQFKGKDYTCIELNESSFDGASKDDINIALFSAGSDAAKIYAPIAAKNNYLVIDNSSCWRMDENVPLVVPEVNKEDIFKHKGIIANPNCSTIQAVVALKPLHDAYNIKRIVYSTYQAVSGAAREGIEDLLEGYKGAPPKKFPHPIVGNCIPHIDVFLDNGYTKEEMKMVKETNKIMHSDIKITATTVRVPVLNGHSESINVEFEKQFDLAELKEILAKAPGIIIQDDPTKNVYPTALQCDGKNEVFVGRIRRDESVDSGVNLWVVADNVRKGAATNAVQIAIEYINATL